MNPQLSLATRKLSVHARSQHPALAARPAGMGRNFIRGLPTELKTMVAASIDDPEDIKSLAYVNKDFQQVIKTSQAKLCVEILKKCIGDDFLSLGVAVAHSRALQKVPRAAFGMPRPTLDLSVEDIVSFVDDHFPPKGPEAIVASYRDMDLKLCDELFAFHKVVDNYADIICQPPDFQNIGEDAECDNLEKRRVRKALYLLQLLSNLFPRGDVSNSTFGETQEKFRPAWTHLLTRFAPWELQQVRAVHQLLLRHVVRVIQADAFAKGGYDVADPRLMFTFVANEGLFALKHLEDMGNQCGTLGAFRVFSKLSKNHEPANAWYGWHDLTWLYKAGKPVELDVTDIISRYPDPDSGPRDVWLYTLLISRVNRPVLHLSFLRFLTIYECLGRVSYVFWGRNRLDRYMSEVYRGLFPSTADMLSVPNVAYDVISFIRTARFRSFVLGQDGTW